MSEVPLFYQDRDGHWFPTLRILHQYPDMMPKLRTGKSAVLQPAPLDTDTAAVPTQRQHSSSAA